MRDRSIDEFESVFERASIPVFEIPEVELTGVSAVLQQNALDTSIIELASHLKKRYGAEVSLHRPKSMHESEMLALANQFEFQPCNSAFGDMEELVAQVHQVKSKLVLLPDIEHDGAAEISLDALVERARPPVMIVREHVEHPEAVFNRILRCLTGDFEHTRNFAYAFALTAPGGLLELLHTIASEEIEDVKRALKVSPEVSDAQGDELLEAISHHGERFLKGVALAGKEQPFEVRYRVLVGNVLDVIEREVSQGGYGLLIVGRHLDGQSHVEAAVYQLMHVIRSIPVLAL